jgi:integrase
MKYASVIKRPGRNKWYMVFWDPKRQKRVQEATPLSVDDPQGHRKALDLISEKSKWAQADRKTKGVERWENWVSEFLEGRYKGVDREKTLIRMQGGWDQWRAYLEDNKFPVPRALDYNGVLGFVKWRSAQIKPSSGKMVSKNTALCDVRVMSVIMREAMRRGYANINPCEKLGIQKDAAKEKREITDEELKIIRRELATRPLWMQTSFEIAIHQGCRLSETALPLERVDLDRKKITFKAKGRKGSPHVFTTALHPGLRPLFEKMKREKAKMTCELPIMAAKEWHFFFKEINLSDLSFHCTRVTVITRLARAGVPISEAMAYVGHASETIHRVYQKLASSDLTRATDALTGIGGKL